MTKSINTKEVEYLIDTIIDQSNYLRETFLDQNTPLGDHIAKKLGHNFYVMKDIKELFEATIKITDIELIED